MTVEKLIRATELQLEAKLELTKRKLIYPDKLESGRNFLESAFLYLELHRELANDAYLSEALGVLSLSGSWDIIMRELEIRKIAPNRISTKCKIELNNLFLAINKPLVDALKVVDQNIIDNDTVNFNGETKRALNRLSSAFPCTITANWFSYRISAIENRYDEALFHLEFLLKYNPDDKYKSLKLKHLLELRRLNEAAIMIDTDNTEASGLYNLTKVITLRRISKETGNNQPLEKAGKYLLLINPNTLTARFKQVYQLALIELKQYMNPEHNSPLTQPDYSQVNLTSKNTNVSESSVKQTSAIQSSPNEISTYQVNNNFSYSYFLNFNNVKSKLQYSTH